MRGRQQTNTGSRTCIKPTKNIRSTISLDIFFFYRYGDRRHLHSFPTRPLPILHGSGRLPEGEHALHDGEGDRRARLPPAHRLEEHTAELQSRLHLVCRRLLEKKKILDLGQTVAASNTAATVRTMNSRFLFLDLI